MTLKNQQKIKEAKKAALEILLHKNVVLLASKNRSWLGGLLDQVCGGILCLPLLISRRNNSYKDIPELVKYVQQTILRQTVLL